jgi:hypothetical protein
MFHPCGVYTAFFNIPGVVTPGYNYFAPPGLNLLDNSKTPYCFFLKGLCQLFNH